MNKIDLKIIALRRAVWGVHEVCVFLDCSKTKAYHEIAWCHLRFGEGTAEKKVSRDKFLEYKGTTLQAEMNTAYIEKEARDRAQGTEVFPRDLQK